MNRFVFLLVLVCTVQTINAQYIYTIKADSVKITNSCDTAELIIENHTQTVPGFLFNKGRGRTEFRRAMQGINDTLVMIGPDTLRIPYAWVQGGNRWNTTGVFGTMDNNHIDFYTNSLPRARLLNNGNWQIGNNPFDYGHKVQIGDVGAITINPRLSRSGDRIQIGGSINTGDGQNILMRVSRGNGEQARNILIERDGYIGIGSSDPPTNSPVGNPSIGIFQNGMVNFISKYGTVMGVPGGPYNASSLATYINNAENEWTSGPGVTHSKNNYYFFGTQLNGPEEGKVRANLRLSGRELHFYTGPGNGLDGFEAARFNEKGHLLIGTTDDPPQVYGGSDNKLQVNGNAWVTQKTTDTLTVGGRIIQGYTQEAQMGNGLIFRLTPENYAQIITGNRIIYESQNHGDQHVFQNTIGKFFTGTLVTIDPGPEPVFPPDQLALKVVTRDLFGLVVTMRGRTGVGTMVPTAQFHTKGTVRLEGLGKDNTQAQVLVTDSNGYLYYRDASSLMAFNGTMNSDLAVNGTVSAQKMLISKTGRWPDYVFSKQYKLPSLREVENFINQNSHLPGIPSAAEVEKKGLDVADTQAGLLRKIEELTLYAIEQEKKLQKQSEEIAELKNQNKELESLRQQMAELKAMIRSAKQSVK